MRRSLVIPNGIPPQIKTVLCHICKKQFNSKSINNHIHYEENKHFGNYIRFQSSKFVCSICYEIINDFSSEHLKIHREKNCLGKKYIE